MTRNPQSLTGDAVATPVNDSSFDSQELAGIGFVVVFILKFDGCR
ncbi:hypothetical protein [Nostoc commune]|nr:hypothetical protein [Nostoc commune]